MSRHTITIEINIPRFIQRIKCCLGFHKWTPYQNYFDVGRDIKHCEYCPISKRVQGKECPYCHKRHAPDYECRTPEQAEQKDK